MLYDVGASIIRTGFGGLAYHNHNKEPPKPLLIIEAPILVSTCTNKSLHCVESFVLAIALRAWGGFI